MLSSSPDVPKSALALIFAFGVAEGPPVAGVLGVPIASSRPQSTLFLSTRDTSDTVQLRLNAIMRRLGSAADAAFAPKNLYLGQPGIDGFDIRRLSDACALKNDLLRLDARLAVVDCLDGVHSADPKDAEQMLDVLGAFESVASDTGAAILLLQAIPTPTSAMRPARNAAEEIAARVPFAASLVPMPLREAKGLSDPDRPMSIADCDKDEMRRHYVRYSVSKSEFCETPADIWYRYGVDGIPVSAGLASTSRSRAGVWPPASRFAEAATMISTRLAGQASFASAVACAAQRQAQPHASPTLSIPGAPTSRGTNAIVQLLCARIPGRWRSYALTTSKSPKINNSENSAGPGWAEQ